MGKGHEDDLIERSTLQSPSSHKLPEYTNTELRPLGSDIFEQERKIYSTLPPSKDSRPKSSKPQARLYFTPGRSLRQEADQAFERARQTFGYLGSFERHNYLPHRFHIREESIVRYENIMGTAFPSIWFIPEMIYLRDILGKGLKSGWWQKEANFPHLPTVSPYLDDNTHELHDRGGVWAIWQPTAMPLSGLASLEEQRKMLKRLSAESGLSIHEIRIGDIVEQAVLWFQALKYNMISSDLCALRSDTVLPESHLANSWARMSKTNLSLIVTPQDLEIADYGNDAEMHGLGISPFVI